MKKIVLIFTLIFLCSCGYKPTVSPVVIDTIETSTKNDITGPVIKFLNWNIHKEGNEKKWLHNIKNQNCTKKPDIISFQEAKIDTGLKYALKFKKFDWTFVSNGILRGEYIGVLTASKSKSLFHQVLVSEGREPITETPKVSLITSYNVNTNGTVTGLLVANIHAMNFVKLDNFKKQLSDLKKALLPYVGTKAIIVSGDFNTWSSQRTHELNRLMASLGLVKAPLKKITTPPWYAWWLPIIEKLPLDHVYYSDQKLAIKKSEVIQTKKWWRKGGCINSSDHKPIYIEFLVR